MGSGTSALPPEYEAALSNYRKLRAQETFLVNSEQDGKPVRAGYLEQVREQVHEASTTLRQWEDQGWTPQGKLNNPKSD